jgi:transposase InsO family protein
MAAWRHAKGPRGTPLGSLCPLQGRGDIRGPVRVAAEAPDNSRDAQLASAVATSVAAAVGVRRSDGRIADCSAWPETRCTAADVVVGCLSPTERRTTSPDLHPPRHLRLCREFVGDITYLPTGEGWLYLATVINLHTREVAGHAMADTCAPTWPATPVDLVELADHPGDRTSDRRPIPVVSQIGMGRPVAIDGLEFATCQPSGAKVRRDHSNFPSKCVER